MARAALLAGKHVLCEKPLAVSVEEAQELAALAAQKGLRNGLCHNLRYYPMVQQMRAMREAGELGEIVVCAGHIFPGLAPLRYRLELARRSKAGGPSRCMADIGSHWFDMAEHLTGLRVTALCADLTRSTKPASSRKDRSRPLRTSSSRPEDVIETPIDTEDFGAVVFRMGERARGAMTASQVSAGRKNRLSIEIYGTKSGVAWDQERPDELWIGHRDSANCIIIKDPSLLKPEARAYADLPGGHSEGYDDTLQAGFAAVLCFDRRSCRAADYPQFIDGLRQLVDPAQPNSKAAQRARWIDVPQPEPAPMPDAKGVRLADPRRSGCNLRLRHDGRHAGHDSARLIQPLRPDPATEWHDRLCSGGGADAGLARRGAAAR